MYYEIQTSGRLGSANKIGQAPCVSDGVTVKKYYAMNEADLKTSFWTKAKKVKTFASFKDFVRSRLEEFPETPAAQLFDWLKEATINCRMSCKKTSITLLCKSSGVYIPFRGNVLESYGPGEELPYGEQAQVTLE